MKRIYQKAVYCLSIALFMFLSFQHASAQCNNLTLSLTRTNSTCLANGSIRVTVGGADVGNIEQSTMQFQVSGDKDLAFANYANNTIENLPAGTYTITLKAFCNISNDWIVATTTATTTITSTYREMNFTFSRVIPTLNCRPTGIARLFIESGTGTPPFTVEMTDSPGGYTGPKTFTITTRTDSIKNLAAGNYTFKVSDDCGYTIENRSITVGTMASDFYNVFYQYLQSARTVNACDIVQTYSLYPSSGTDPDGNFYHYTNVQDFFEVAFLYNDTGTKNWQPITRYNTMNITIPSPHTMKSMRENNHYFMAYIRVKGCTTEHTIRLSLTTNISMDLRQSVSGCDTISLNFYSHANYNTTICYPYEWRVVDNVTGVPFSGFDWQGSVTTTATQVAYNVPTGNLRVEFRDAEGTTWNRTLTTSLPKPTLQTVTAYNYTYKEPDGVYRTYIYPYFYPSTFPVGTTFKFLPGSGSTPPANLTGTTTTASTAFYPYSQPPFNTVYTTDYVRLDSALYRFEVTRPGCTPDTVQATPWIYKLQSPPVYEITEECDGLLVTFKSGGQLEYSYWNTNTNAVVTSTTGTPHIRIGGGPSGDLTKVVPHGGSLKLPLAGRYYIHLLSGNSSTGTAHLRDTIDYEPTPFTLDNTVTSAYLCQGEATGFIRVKGTGGAGGYKYQLYDNGSLKFTNTSGVFNYGVGGGTYTVVLSDTICGSSYPQDVTLIDLGIAQIAYSSSPDNKFCTVDSIYLKCLTLGETTYTWTGSGIDTVNTASPAYKNKQNPVLAASDVGVGTHTYTITVTPESCGTEMTQTVTILVEDCDGARDDYHTMLKNTTDSVDILANDGFPSACAASVTPVITVAPTKGTATIVNKKVVYTPTTDFVGKDSLTYRTVCSGTTTTAKVYFNVITYPDNIVEADCYIPAVAVEWGINEMQSLGNSHNYMPPFVGDMDGNGIPEIVTGAARGGVTSHGGTQITIFGDGGTKPRLDFTTEANYQAFMPGVIALARVKISATKDTAMIVVAESDGFLRAYDINGTKLWTSFSNIAGISGKWNDVSNVNYGTSVAFADFNCDGYTEVYSGNKIFDAATGELLCAGLENRGYSANSVITDLTVTFAIDVCGDSRLELAAGNQIYDVNIVSRTNPSLNSMNVIRQVAPPYSYSNDGLTQAIDIDNDGKLEILVERRETAGHLIYIWSPEKQTVLASMLFPDANAVGIPFIGDIDGCGKPEIVFITSKYPNAALDYCYIYALKYDEIIGFSVFWKMKHADTSGHTGITLFDFNQDNKAELVYRDEKYLRILNGSGVDNLGANMIDGSGNLDIESATLYKIASLSGTGFEYPVVADIDNDGQAEIIVGGGITGDVSTNALRIFKSSDMANAPWAPARKVWNQYLYNAVNVNENLTIPATQLSSTFVFPGEDGILGTADDIRPYNNFLQQQTVLNLSGTPLWLAPDIYPDPSLVSSSIVGDSVSITIGMINQGDAAIGSPVYVALYKESLTAANRFAVDSANVQILPGNTGYVTVRIPDMTPHLPILKIIVRVNDNGSDFTDFMYQPECDDTNNVMTILNPAMTLMMKKNAKLEGVPHDGTYPNPVSVLYNEDIEYTITAVNANISAGKVIIRDTLPPYLKYQSSDPTIVPTTVGSNPQRVALEWTINGVASMATTSVKVVATPEEGCVSSQPMFINRAWVLVSDTIYVPTNYTYHQGACIGVATFSAGFGGNIYGATEQALDYKTTPRSGIVIVPDEGYRFAGWSHEDYVSLRSEKIKAQSGIMHYDTLTIFGNVDLQANFELEEYPVYYYLNGGKSLKENPSNYTIKSGAITLQAPEKAGDVFTGWTGSNGNIPQQHVTIGGGTTGELEFYANFLYSGQEDVTASPSETEDKLWSAGNELYIRTSIPGCIVKIYSVDGTLQKQQTIVHVGETKIRLLQGIYIVTLDDDIGQKIKIE